MCSETNVLGRWVRVLSPGSKVQGPQGLGPGVMGPGLGRRAPEGITIRRGDLGLELACET